MTQRLAMLSLLVPDYDAGIAFFVGKMGFELLEDTDLGGGKRWVKVGPKGAQTAFLLAKAVGAQQAAIGNQGGGRVWLFLQTDDFARDHAAMLAADVHFEEAPRDEPYGQVAVFADPFGNRWDLIQFKGERNAKAVVHQRSAYQWLG
jgi:catechol 2,3-dioxygenase-like lactoylglutathione lyase family enzyme